MSVASTTQESSQQDPSAANRVRVLVVDDDAGVRDVLRAVLVEEHYDVFVADSAESALEVARDLAPDIVISDMKMPGHDGVWLLEALQRDYPDIGVVMLTGFGDTETAVECLRRGAADYLLKPPRVLDLVRSIERAVS